MEILTASESGDVIPAVQRPTSPVALRSTQAPKASISPNSSAMGMNVIGGTNPSPGRFQRTRASTPTIRPVPRSIWGW
jgi:hypothetical protein